jgi:hypothetical protein
MNIPAGDTRFSFFGGDFRIGGKRVHSNELRLDSQSLEASLRGSSGFDQTLDYSGSGLLKGDGGSQEQQQQSSNPLGGFGKVFGKVMQQTVGRMRVPFTVRGTFADPKFMTGVAAPAR